jgi:hypothetical protein
VAVLATIDDNLVIRQGAGLRHTQVRNNTVTQLGEQLSCTRAPNPPLDMLQNNKRAQTSSGL